MQHHSTVAESRPLLLLLLLQASDIMYFMRSGSTLSPSLTRLFWLGDQMVTWDSHDGLATVIIGMLSSGLSGYSMQHSDIGGYTSIIVPLVDIRYNMLPEVPHSPSCALVPAGTYAAKSSSSDGVNWQPSLLPTALILVHYRMRTGSSTVTTTLSSISLEWLKCSKLGHSTAQS